MKSFTLVLQVVSIALIATAWGAPPHAPITGAWKKELLKPQQNPFAAVDDDYALTPATDRPFRIIAAEQKVNETREEFLARKRLQEEELRRQAESATYSFASALSDRIMDSENTRSETREGLKTTGMYSYSDGFVRRTVRYIADENGYRVIEQTEEPIGDGPQPDPTGSADVATYYDHSKLQYSITADDIRGHFTEEEEEEDEVTTKTPLPPFPFPLQRSSAPRTPVAPVVTAPKIQVSNDFDTRQILRPTERHDAQTPLRPTPTPDLNEPTPYRPRPAERHDAQTPLRPVPTQVHDDETPLRPIPTERLTSPTPVRPIHVETPVEQTPTRPIPTERFNAQTPLRPTPTPVLNEPTPYRPRPAERHDAQTPLRPFPALRGQYFTQVHSF